MSELSHTPRIFTLNELNTAKPIPSILVGDMIGLDNGGIESLDLLANIFKDMLIADHDAKIIEPINNRLTRYGYRGDFETLTLAQQDKLLRDYPVLTSLKSDETSLKSNVMHDFVTGMSFLSAEVIQNNGIVPLDLATNMPYSGWLFNITACLNTPNIESLETSFEFIVAQNGSMLRSGPYDAAKKRIIKISNPEIKRANKAASNIGSVATKGVQRSKPKSKGTRLPRADSNLTGKTDWFL